MPPGWSVKYSKQFFSALSATVDNLELRLDQARQAKGTHQETAVSSIKADIQLSSDLLDKIDEIYSGRINPATLPGVRNNNTPIPNFHFIEVGPWQGYYYLDNANKICLGTLILHKDYTPENLENALNEAREDKG